MKEQKKFKDLDAFIGYADESKDVLNEEFISAVWNDEKFDEEYEKMFNHMTNTLENITGYKIAKLEFDLINEEYKLIFIFEATNVSYKDLRSYTIVL